MYIYNLGYYSHEESEYISLYHKDKFTQKEFEEFVMNATFKIIEGSGDQELTFQDIFSEVVEELVKSYGFTEVKFDAEFSAFGWAHILDKDDWKAERGESLDKLADFIKNKPKTVKK
jgi:hypothetical protein